MAAGIGLVSVTQIQNLSKSQQHHQNQPTTKNPNSSTSSPPPPSSTWMWNPRDHQADQDDSWEVRAFAEDTSNIMGTTWPPRSYTCTFCRREFRSAQALGGHMNVHRRDRARLHQAAASPINSNNNHISSFTHTQYPSVPSSLNQEPFANGGLCLLYPFPSPNNVAPFSSSLGHHHTSFNNNNNNACGDSPSTVFSVSSSSHYSQYPPMRVPSCSATSFDFSLAQPAPGRNVFSSYSGKVEQQPTASSSTHHGHHHDELDLELRLGNRSTST